MEEMKNEDIYSRITRVGSDRIPVKYSAPKLDAYVIQQEIGRGGMAVVYEAVEKSLDRTVALKVLSEDFSKDAILIRRFVDEAQSAARLNHPNIVQIYSIGEERGVYYFAMEYVRGKSVEKMLEESGKLSCRECLGIIKQAALALRDAYANSIVHRDIKPGNIMIAENSVVKITDFGLAGEVKTAPLSGYGGKIIGTPLYMSPERAQGREGDCRSDMYSLGITFYQMISGDLPFMSSDTKALIEKQIEKPLPPLPQDIPSFVRKIIYTMTEKDPKMRFSDYQSLINELDKALSRLRPRSYKVPVLVSALLLGAGIAVYFSYRGDHFRFRQVEIPENIDRAARIADIYRNVVDYARENPEAYGDIIKQYFEVIREYPDTEWAYRAEQKIDMIVVTAVREGAEEIRNLKPIRDELMGERRYGEIIDRYDALSRKYRDTTIETLSRENMDYILNEARKDFAASDKKAKEYINSLMFDEAREEYREVIRLFGIADFIEQAKDMLSFLDTVQREHKDEQEAFLLLNNIEENVDALLAKHEYNSARNLVEDAVKNTTNPVFLRMLSEKLKIIETAQTAHESEILKKKMDEQRLLYKNALAETSGFISKYDYTAALSALNRNLSDVEVSEWKKELEALRPRLEYLLMFKERLLDGINRDLGAEGINIKATDGTLVFAVGDGYVGVPWAETRPEEIYAAAKKHLSGDAEGHLAMGIFCLSYDLDESARKEFSIALRMQPAVQGIVEKYLVELSEK